MTETVIIIVIEFDTVVIIIIIVTETVIIIIVYKLVVWAMRCKNNIGVIINISFGRL